MSDNEKRLYEPRVRPREREDVGSGVGDSETRVVLRISREAREGRVGFGAVITVPTIHEVPLVPGPKSVQ